MPAASGHIPPMIGGTNICLVLLGYPIADTPSPEAAASSKAHRCVSPDSPGDGNPKICPDPDLLLYSGWLANVLSSLVIMMDPL